MSETLAKATKDLLEAQESLEESRSAEGRQLRRLKKQTDEVKDAQKQFENSLRETVKSMSFADLGKQLKKDLLSPFEGFLNNLPAPVKTLGMIGMKAAQGAGNAFKKATDPGVRFDAEGTKRWRKMHDDGKMGKIVSNAEAEAAGATKESHTAGNEQIGLLASIKTGIFKLVAAIFAMVNWFKKKFAKPDSSKKAEDDIEGKGGEGGVDAGGGDDGGGIFGGIGKTFKKIKSFIKKFISWKGMVVLLIGSIIAGLAIKYWEPIKEIVLKIKDKIMGIYNAIKEWFVSLWDWGVAKGTDEDGEWSVTTFITNIWKDIKKWFEDKWIWISGSIAEGWTTVTDYISGKWKAVKKWFSDLWAWGKSDDPSEGWKLTTFIGTMFTGLKDWFFGLFGLKKDQTELDWETGEMKTIKGDWSFSGLIKKIFGGLKNWFFGLFGMTGDTTELDWETGEMKTIKGDWSFSGLIGKIFTGLKDWFFGLFGLTKDQEELDWETGEMKTIKGDWSFSGLISKIFTGLKNWFFGLFGIEAEKGELSPEDFAKIASGFSLPNLIMKAVRGIGDFFWKGDGTGLLEFDLSGIKEKMFDIGAVLGAVGKATKAAIASLPMAFLGGEGPIDTFKRVLKESMPSSGGGSVSKESDPFASTYAGGGSVSKESDPFASTYAKEPDFTLPLAGGAQIVAEKPIMQEAAISLASAGPQNARGMGDQTVVDASTSTSSSSNSSNTNVTVVNKLPVTASDPYTTKQYRRFRGMRGGGT